MSDDNDDLLDPAEIEALLNEAGAGQPPAPPPKAGAGAPSTATGDAASSAQPAAGATTADGDHMSQDDLDRLMAEATSGTASLAGKPKKATPPQQRRANDDDGDLLDPSEIEQLLNSQNPAGAEGRAAATKKSAAANMSAETEELLRQAEAGLAAAISSDGGGGFGKPGPFGNPQPYKFQEFGKSLSNSTNVALKTLHDVELDIRIELGRTELLIEEVLHLRDGSVVPLDKLAGDPVDVIVNERLIARGEVLVLNDNFCVRITEILPPHL